MTKDRQAGRGLSTTATASADTGEDADSTEEADNTREQSDKNINKFNRLVVYDKETERKSKYQSEVRGRVQDRNVRIDLEPQFVLTYYEKPEQVKRLVYYDRMVEEFNRQMVLSRGLRITNQEAALNEGQIDEHFNSVNDFSSRIHENDDDLYAYFGRAIDYMLVQNFMEAITDYDKVISLDPTFTMAFFNRAIVRFKQLEYTMAQQTSASASDELTSLSATINIGGQVRNVTKPVDAPSVSPTAARDNRSFEYELIVRDYDSVIRLNPDFVYAYYNRGYLRCMQRDFRAAIQDFNEAINRDPNFAEAYFNRGLARLSLGDARQGIADLSKAGELGIIDAYSIIKRMTVN